MSRLSPFTLIVTFVCLALVGEDSTAECANIRKLVQMRQCGSESLMTTP